MKQSSILIVGAGRLGSTLALRLGNAGYEVSQIRSRKSPRPREILVDIVWFCVPDSEIAHAIEKFPVNWRNKYAFHSSGVLTSDVLAPLRFAAASIASVHPLMTFVKRSIPELTGVPFAVEGDARAVRLARKIVVALGGKAFAIEKKDKVAYHAVATMICPLLVSLLAAAEQAASLADMSAKQARTRILPILRQTLQNYETLGPAASFSGPLVRGDIQTMNAHLQALNAQPFVKQVYVALARGALEYLPVSNKSELDRILKKESLRT